jgi:hypothetical protein
MFIRFSLWNLKLQQPQLPRSEPDEQLNESSHLANNASGHFGGSDGTRTEGGSGGFGPTLSVPDRGGVRSRVRGLVLLDALYIGIDKFANWIAENRSTFYVSSYTPQPRVTTPISSDC